MHDHFLSKAVVWEPIMRPSGLAVPLFKDALIFLVYRRFSAFAIDMQYSQGYRTALL